MADTKISALTAATTPLAGTEVLPIVQSGTTKQVSVANLTAGRSVSVSNLTNSGLTSGRVPYSSTGGLQIDSANFTYDGNTLSLIHTSGTGLSINRNSKSLTLNANNASGDVYAAITSTAGMDIAFLSGGSEILRAVNNGNVNINNGNIVPGTAAKGINFTANTAAAGMTSQLLNWYEEGTWTPTLYGTGGSAGTYAATASGTYTRVGRLVHVMGSVSISNKGSWSGTVQVDAPFTPSGQSGTGAVRSQLNTFDGTLVCEWSTSGSALRFNVTKTGTGQVTLQWTDLVTSGYLQFSLTYFV